MLVITNEMLSFLGVLIEEVLQMYYEILAIQKLTRLTERRKETLTTAITRNSGARRIDWMVLG